MASSEGKGFEAHQIIEHKITCDDWQPDDYIILRAEEEASALVRGLEMVVDEIRG
jgi:hypothetical protein